MTLIELLLALIVIGVVLYLVQLIPMDGTFKQIIRVLVILFAVLWVLTKFGLISGFHIS